MWSAIPGIKSYLLSTVNLKAAISESFPVSVAVTKILRSATSVSVPEKVFFRALKFNQTGNGLPSSWVAV